MSEDAMRQVAVRELLENFFDGSAQNLARFLGAPEIAAAAAASGDPASKAEPEVRIDTVLL
jgi:hypothetical protein